MHHPLWQVQGPYFCTVSIALTLEAQRPGYLVLIGAHVIPVAILATEGARYERAETSFGGVAELTTNVAAAGAVFQHHIVQLECQVFDRAVV